MEYGPFQNMILTLNQRITYATMAVKCLHVRSDGWFNTVALGYPDIRPPEPKILGQLGRAFGMTQEQVAALVAESWYGVRSADVSDRVRKLAPAIDALDDESAELVGALVARLAANPEE